MRLQHFNQKINQQIHTSKNKNVSFEKNFILEIPNSTLEFGTYESKWSLCNPWTLDKVVLVLIEKALKKASPDILINPSNKDARPNLRMFINPMPGWLTDDFEEDTVPSIINILTHEHADEYCDEKKLTKWLKPAQGEKTFTIKSANDLINFIKHHLFPDLGIAQTPEQIGNQINGYLI